MVDYWLGCSMTTPNLSEEGNHMIAENPHSGGAGVGKHKQKANYSYLL